MYDHRNAKFEFVGPHYMFFEPLAADYAAALPLIDHIPPEELGAFVPLLFPNLGLAETENSWSIFHIIPLGPESTQVITRTKVMDQSSLSFTWQALRSASFWSRRSSTKYESAQSPDDPMMSGDFMAEDIFACEQQQKSLHSPLFSVGASAQHTESSVRGFQAIIRDWMDEKQT